MRLRLAVGPDAADRARAAFERFGWARIAPFLRVEDAVAIEAHLRQRTDWRQHLNQGEKLFELDRETRASFPPEKAAALDKAVFRNASEGFQFRFEGLRLPDAAAARAADTSLLGALGRLLDAPATLDLFRHVCNDRRIRFADAQATLYAPGDFLTEHDDDVAGKNRIAAWTLGLNPRWSIDWGGLLHLMDDEGQATALVPGFNLLTVFRVPRRHSVSLVSPAAPVGRLGITGWLRAGPRPA
jgi:Predicted proline hydroxylase